MTGAPLILAFDTSGPWLSAALVRGETVLSEIFEELSKGQAERLMPALKEMFDAEGLVWEELDAIGVGVGPGNFTGIRISVSAARGLALGLGIPAIGVSGFEILHAKEARSVEERHLITLEMRRGGHYLHEMKDGRLTGAPQILAEAHPMTPRPPLDAGADVVVLGPNAGDVAYIIEQQHGRPVNFRDTEFPAPLAGRLIARVATAQHVTGVSSAPPAPFYIRPPDAAPARDAPPRIVP